MKKMSLAEKIYTVMELKGMTQADLARKTGLSTALIAQVLTERTKDPRFSTVVKIAKALDIPLEYLAP